MRVLHLTPGTGTFHCGSCLRDNVLIKALRGRGHEAIMVPLYLPLVTDREPASPGQEIRVGGINLYFQQKFPWFYHLPEWLHRALNRPALLRLAARGMGMTSARLLGEMTLGSLLGKDGRQWAEWRKLVTWLKDNAHPDVVSLSNSLLTGLAPAIREELGVPVVVSLQGEDSFLDTLAEPWKEQAWEALQRNAESVCRFIAPSRFYQEMMAPRLGVPLDRITVLPNALPAHAFHSAEPDLRRPVIGYLARMIHGKGLTTFVDALIDLATQPGRERVRFHIGGALTPADHAYVEDLKKKIQQAGLTSRVTWMPNLTFEEKLRFYRDLTLFSVPATYGEAFGLYVLEAMTCGVPVVQPQHGAFPELIDATGGGVLCAPDDAAALARAWAELLDDPERLADLRQAGQRAVARDFQPTLMAERFDAVLTECRSA